MPAQEAAVAAYFVAQHTYFCEKFVPGLIQSALYDPCHTSVIGLTLYTGGTHILGTRLRSFCGVGEPPYLPACFEGHMYRCLPPWLTRHTSMPRRAAICFITGSQSQYMQKLHTVL